MLSALSRRPMLSITEPQNTQNFHDSQEKQSKDQKNIISLQETYTPNSDDHSDNKKKKKKKTKKKKKSISDDDEDEGEESEDEGVSGTVAGGRKRKRGVPEGRA